jgi:hypothetical protein
MKKSERNLLVITIGAALLLLISWVHGSKGKRMAPAAAGIPDDQTATFPTLPDIDDKYYVLYSEERLDSLPIPPDMKDPFGIYVPDTKESEKAAETEVRLTGIFRSGERSYALLSQEIVVGGETKTRERLAGEGEAIGGWTITQVDEEGVWLSKAGRRRFLKLHKPKQSREQRTDTPGSSDNKSVNREEDE